MAVSEIIVDANGGGTNLTDTDWMGYYIIPYSGYNTQFILCTKGYSKIGIKVKTAGTTSRIDIYTANYKADNTTKKSSSETLIGSASTTTETVIDVSGNDYVWFYCYDGTGGSNKEGWYRLLV